MFEFLTTLIDVEIDYIGVLTAVFLYISIMWVMFCIWVFIDARKRFDNILVAVLFALFVLPLNIPGFILYLIVRPENDEWPDISAIDASGNQYHYGGVQVPLVHFTGSEGEVKLTFGLSINPKSLQPGSPDMNIDVSWDGQRTDMAMRDSKPIERPESAAISSGVAARNAGLSKPAFANISSRLKGSIKSITSSVSSSLSSSSKKLNMGEDVQDVPVVSDKPQNNTAPNTNQNSKKHKKSKNRR